MNCEERSAARLRACRIICQSDCNSGDNL